MGEGTGAQQGQMAGGSITTDAKNLGRDNAGTAIVGDGADHRFTVDQTQPLPAGEAFREVGRLRLRQGMDYTLTVANEDTKGFVILDAVQLLPVAAPAK